MHTMSCALQPEHHLLQVRHPQASTRCCARLPCPPLSLSLSVSFWHMLMTSYTIPGICVTYPIMRTNTCLTPSAYAQHISTWQSLTPHTSLFSSSLPPSLASSLCRSQHSVQILPSSHVVQKKFSRRPSMSVHWPHRKTSPHLSQLLEGQ